MRKLFYVTTIITILLVSFLGITYSYEYNEDDSLKFELIGPYELYLDVNTEYEEYGVKVIKSGYDVSSSVKINSSLVNMNVIGEYKVKYEIDVDGTIEYVYRVVKVIDNISPEIKLNGEEIMYVDLNDTYYEFGCVVTDNYDTDLSENLDITSDVDVTRVGEYRVEYRVSDSSGNEAKIERIVKVIDNMKEN